MMQEESVAPAATSQPFANPVVGSLLPSSSKDRKEQAMEHDRGQLREARRLQFGSKRQSASTSKPQAKTRFKHASDWQK